MTNARLTKLMLGITAVATTLVLAGCAVAGTSPNEGETPMSSKTLDEAKAETMAVTQEVLDLIPADSVGEQRIVSEATLMDCGDDEFKWPGGATIVVTDSFQPDEFLGAVEDEFTGRADWTVTRETVQGAPSVEARRGDGLSVYSTIAREGSEIWVRSFSVCFPFDPAVGKKY